MAAKLIFHRDQFGGPASRAVDQAYTALGSLLTSDIQNSEYWCLEILCWIEDVRAGRSARESWLGNSWSGELTSSGFDLEDLYSDDWGGHYSLDESHEVLIEYLNFLAPGNAAKSADLERWENEYKRPHPCRDHLNR